MKETAVTLGTLMLLLMPVSCGGPDEIQRTAEAYRDMNDYINSSDYSAKELNYTTDNGEVDYFSLYMAVYPRFESIADNHGFESVDQWLEAYDRYMEEEVMSSARTGYYYQADDMLREMMEYGGIEYRITPDRLRRLMASSDEITDYIDSGEIETVMMDQTTDSGETDYQAVQEIVTGRYLEIVNRHGFHSIDEWEEAADYYLNCYYDEMLEFNYDALVLLETLEQERFTGQHEEPMTRFSSDSTGMPYISSTGDDDGVSPGNGEK